MKEFSAEEARQLTEQAIFNKVARINIDAELAAIKKVASEGETQIVFNLLKIEKKKKLRALEFSVRDFKPSFDPDDNELQTIVSW